MKKMKKTSRRQAQQDRKKPSFPAWAWLSLVAAGMLLVAVLALTRPDQTAQPPQNQARVNALPGEVPVVEAVQMRIEGAFILDVREQHEWDEYHIPYATLIPLGELKERLNEVPRDRDIVVVCRSGNRSATARDILLEAGFTRVTSMAGGMQDWQAQGFAIESGSD